MKTKQSSLKLNRLPSIIFLTTIVFFAFVFVGTIYFKIFKSNTALQPKIADNQEWINKNQHDFTLIFVDMFDQAKQCSEKGNIPHIFSDYLDNCDGLIRSRLDSFNSLLSIDTATATESRKPIYFIRLNEGGYIEKLFQSGVYYQDKIDNSNDLKIKYVLEGKKSPHPFPMFTCDGGDDLPCNWLPLKMILPDRRLLKDFYSEIELIYPIKNESGEIIGAVVILYAD
ncbi:MAG: hypothetical protein ACOZAN_03150 [Patescibacteria group bacterium]